MSRIGKNPIVVPKGVEVKFNDNFITVKGSKGELRQEIDASQQQFIEYQKLIDWNTKILEWFTQTEAAFAKAAPKL